MKDNEMTYLCRIGPETVVEILGAVFSCL